VLLNIAEFISKAGAQMKRLLEISYLTTVRNQEAEPLCRFGPGGDFVTVWQPEMPEAGEPKNRLEKLFASTVEVAAVLLGYKRSHPYIPLINTSSSVKQTLRHKEDMKNAVKLHRIHHPAHAPAARIAPDDSRISAEPMLFPDFGRNGNRVQHQPKHNIRTYRRAAKKRTTVRFAQQGSLFEGQLKSARIA
jgi:hypothetical protein